MGCLGCGVFQTSNIFLLLNLKFSRIFTAQKHSESLKKSFREHYNDSDDFCRCDSVHLSNSLKIDLIKSRLFTHLKIKLSQRLKLGTFTFLGLLNICFVSTPKCEKWYKRNINECSSGLVDTSPRLLRFSYKSRIGSSE